MMRSLVVFFCCLPLCGQRHTAGTRADGRPLTVVEKHFPDRAPDARRCVPREQWLLDAKPLVTLCQTDDQAEISVEVKPNLLTVSRNGGAQAGYSMSAGYQLSPWRAATADACSFLGSDEFTYERWDLRSLHGEAWRGKASENDDALCEPGDSLFTYLLVPTIAVDAQSLAAAHTALGSCSARLDASGENGYVTWGKPDAHDPLEIRLLWTGPRTLIAQVSDPHRNTKPAASWIHADHIEIWMSSGGAMWQFGIPVDDAPVQVGYGKPKQLPQVKRWNTTRSATVLSIELPAQPDGVTILYSQSNEGRAQKRLIATSRVKRGDSSTLGTRGSALAHNDTSEYVTCSTVAGSLEITGGPKTPIEVSAPQH